MSSVWYEVPVGSSVFNPNLIFANKIIKSDGKDSFRRSRMLAPSSALLTMMASGTNSSDTVDILKSVFQRKILMLPFQLAMRAMSSSRTKVTTKRRRDNKHGEQSTKLALFLVMLLLLQTAGAFTLPPQSNVKLEFNRICSQRAASKEEPQKQAISFQSALCLVPPEEVWDRIQRARFLCRDKTYQKWPPCVRLFHPFVEPSAEDNDRGDGHDVLIAKQIAALIEKYEIEPFQIKWNRWTILPDMEQMEKEWDVFDEETKNGPQDTRTDEEREIDELIAREVEIGKERKTITEQQKLRKQREKELQQAFLDGGEAEANAEVNKPPKNAPPAELKETKRGKKRRLKQRKQQYYEEFNGPCVICLEPDEDSRIYMEDFRDVLAEELGVLAGNDTRFSPTSMFSNEISSHGTGDFRPLLPVGSFPSVELAMETARKLQKMWSNRPLTYDVTDLQIISSPKADTFFGCDAQIMLMGEELEQDDAASELMVEYICEHGSAGGGDPLSDQEQDTDDYAETIFSRSLEDDDESDDAADAGVSSLYDDDGKEKDDEFSRVERELLDWLDESDEDEYDDPSRHITAKSLNHHQEVPNEGACVVLGRCHFFSGDMRDYDSMPAFSTVDTKDYLSYRDRGSGAARRKGTQRRKTWHDGEYGYRESDHH